MNEEEMIEKLIDRFTDLQRIKASDNPTSYAGGIVKYIIQY